MTNLFRRPAVLAACIFIITATGFALTTDAKKIDNFITPFANAKHFSGVVLVAKDRKILYQKAFGTANVEHGVPNKLDTKFGIASLTKPMTSVVLVRLIEARRIGLEDKLSKYIPDFPNGDKITIALLWGHRSGIPHRVMPEYEESKRYTPAQFVEIAKKAELEFEPGEKELYSSAGYAVLARTLELASGKSFDQLLQEYVFTPAQLNDTSDFDSRRILINKADCYLLGTGGFTAAPYKDYSFLVGAGSVFSTARDIYSFGMASIDGKYGKLAKQNLVREGVFRSNGSTNGYRANVRIDTKNKFGYVVVANLASGANDLIISNLRNLLEGKEMSAPVIPNPKIDLKVKNDLNEYVGKYKLGGSSFNVLINERELFAGPFKLLPMGKDKFYSFFMYAEITFVRDESGKVKGLEWVGTGGKTDWVKN